MSFVYSVHHEDGKILHVLGSAKLIEQDGELLYQRFLLDYSDQKHEEERRERRQQSFIRALGVNYLVVCSFDLNTGRGELLRISDDADEELKDIFDGPLTYEKSLYDYVNIRTLPDDRSMLCDMLARDRVREELEERKRINVMYRSFVDGVMGYRQVTLVRAGSWAEDSGDGRLVVMGLRNVDRETREEIERKEQLEEALQRANRANEAKSLFLSNMSHDIRTPMNAIIGFTTLATNHIDDVERVEDYLNKIQASSTHLLDLINDILDMSRIESGKASVEEKPCDLMGGDGAPRLHRPVRGQREGSALRCRPLRIASSDCHVRRAQAEAGATQHTRQCRQVHAFRRFGLVLDIRSRLGCRWEVELHDDDRR